MIWEKYITVMTNKTPLEVRYFVSAPTPEPDTGIPCYGIGISLGGETVSDPTFCTDKGEAVRVCQMLCRNQVTPVTFYAVMDDYFATI